MKRKLLLLFLYILLINQLLAINEKTGLVLSGGGVKGLAHIGTLKVIDSLNINIDYIAGTSIGSIAAALYASGHSADEIERMRKAEAMKKIGKSKGKNKRQRMIDAYNEIIRNRNKRADGGEVSLTVIEIPDISGAGVETLFKKR